MKNGKGILTHKRWLCALMIAVLTAVSLVSVALPALAESFGGVIRNPNGGKNVNVRQWNSFDAPVLMTLVVGTKVEITNVAGDWYTIWAGGKAGCVNSAFVSTGHGSGNNNRPATVTVGPLDMREAPSKRARVITQLTSGANVIVLSYGDTWSQIKSGDLYGYVLSSALSFSATPPPPPPSPPVVTPKANATVKTNNGGNLNLRAWASATSDVLGSYANGTRVRVLTHGASWCRVQVGDKYGYMSTMYLRFDGNTGGGNTGGNAGGNTGGGYNAVVNSAALLNLRAEPSTAAKVLGQYRNGTAIKVLGVGTEWHRVSVGGVTGYMLAKYVKINNASATPHKTVQNNGSFVNLRLGAGYDFPVLKRVSHGAAATVAIPYPVWSRVIVKDGAGYVAGYMLNGFLK